MNAAAELLLGLFACSGWCFALWLWRRWSIYGDVERRANRNRGATENAAYWWVRLRGDKVDGPEGAWAAFTERELAVVLERGRREAEDLPSERKGEG